MSLDYETGGSRPEFSPSVFTPHKCRELVDLRAYERGKRDGTGPDLGNCLGGSSFLGLWRAGTAFVPLGTELAELRLTHAQGIALWAVVIATKRLGRTWEGLIIRHADMAEVLGCSPRTAGTVMRHLTALGYVVRRPWYDVEGRGHVRGACVYGVSDRVLDLLGFSGGGKNCQASEKPQNSGSGNPSSGDRVPVAGVGAVPDPEQVVRKGVVPDGATVPTAATANELANAKLPEPVEPATPRALVEPVSDVRALAMLRKQLATHEQRADEEFRRRTIAVHEAIAVQVTEERRKLEEERQQYRESVAAMLAREAVRGRPADDTPDDERDLPDDERRMRAIFRGRGPGR